MDLLGAARQRGRRLAKEFLDAEGGALSQGAVAKLLGHSADDIEKQRKSGSLLGIPGRNGSYRYPSWQFTRKGTLPGLAKVLGELHKHDPWAQLGFFLSGNYRLNGVTPLETLRQGNVDSVRLAAGAYGEHGAA